MALFFPDAGSAALAKYEWGAGTEKAQVRGTSRTLEGKEEEEDGEGATLESSVRCTERTFAVVREPSLSRFGG